VLWERPALKAGDCGAAPLRAGLSGAGSASVVLVSIRAGAWQTASCAFTVRAVIAKRDAITYVARTIGAILFMRGIMAIKTEA